MFAAVALCPASLALVDAVEADPAAAVALPAASSFDLAAAVALRLAEDALPEASAALSDA